MNNADDPRNGGRKASTDKSKLVLTTSLGVALVANLAYGPAVHGGTATALPVDAKLVEWSSDAVKSYYDAKMDWSLALPAEKNKSNASPQPSATPVPSVGANSGGGNTTTNIYHGGGFGWDDLLLYHLIFNRGGVYASNQWYSGRNVTYAGTQRTYTPQSFDSGKFQNRPVPNSNVSPKTSNSTGSIVRRSTTSTGKSTSSSTGSIGGKSSGFSSGSSSSSSSSGS
jgi:hypothetical protein